MHNDLARLERVDLDMAAGAHRQPAFLKLNPAGKVPVLELDDGCVLIESAAIIEYLEELHPDPPMIGTDDPVERARVRADERIVADLIAWCRCSRITPARSLPAA